MKFKKFESNDQTIKAVAITEDNAMECAKVCHGYATISYVRDYRQKGHGPDHKAVVKMERIKFSYGDDAISYFVDYKQNSHGVDTEAIIEMEVIDKSNIRYVGGIGDYLVNENDDFRIVSKHLFEKLYSETEDDSTLKTLISSETQIDYKKGLMSMVEKDDVGSFCVAKEVLTFFEYRGITGYKAFLAWAMNTGNYIQGDLAVWHMADVSRLVQNDSYDRQVLFVIQNNEYAIIVTENVRNLLVELFKIRVEVLEKEIDKDAQSTPKVGVSL